MRERCHSWPLACSLQTPSGRPSGPLPFGGRRGGRGGVSQTLAPSLSAWTALLIALTNATTLGQGLGQRTALIPTSCSRHEEGDHWQGSWPRLRPGFVSSFCLKAGEDIPVRPTALRAMYGAGRALEASVPEAPLEVREGWDGVLGWPPSGMSSGTSLSLESNSRAQKTVRWLAWRHPNPSVVPAPRPGPRKVRREGGHHFCLQLSPGQGRNVGQRMTLQSKRAVFEF